MKLKFMGKKAFALVLWGIVLLFFVGVLNLPDFSLRIKGLGNTSANISNGGVVAESNGWIYYLNAYDHNSIYKTNGIDDIKLNEHESIYINVVGNWVFYINLSDDEYIHRMKINGKKNENLKVRARAMVVENDWIYYINQEDDNLIYKVRVNGEEATAISSVTATSLAIVDNYIYYISSNTGSLYRVEKNGEKTESITNGIWLGNMIIEHGLIYANGRKDGRSKLFSMDLEGNNLQTILEGYDGLIQSFTMNDQDLFFAYNKEYYWEPINIVKKINLKSGEIDEFAYYEINSFGLTNKNIYIKSDNNLAIIDFEGNEKNYFDIMLFQEDFQLLTSIGNHLGNTISRGQLVENETHIFLKNSDDFIVSYNKVSGETEILNNRRSTNFNLKDHWLYYVGSSDNQFPKVYKMKTDGSMEEKITDDIIPFNLQLNGDILYFFGVQVEEGNFKNHAIYRHNLSTGQLDKLYYSEDIRINLGEFFISDGYLYGEEIVSNSPHPHTNIIRVNLDEEPEVEVLVSGNLTKPFLVIDNKMYYVDNFNTLLQVYDLKTGKDEVLMEEVSYLLNYIGDNIFYVPVGQMLDSSSMRNFRMINVKDKEDIEVFNRTDGYITMLNLSSKFMAFNSYSPQTGEHNIYYISYDGKILNKELFE